MGAQPTVPAPGGQCVHHQTWRRGHPRLLAASQLPAALAVGVRLVSAEEWPWTTDLCPKQTVVALRL